MAAIPESKGFPDDAIRQAAARWIVRRDRGLSAAEAIEFELWLAEDERHAVALARFAGAWALLGRIPDRVGQPLVEAAARRRWRLWAVRGLAAAAVFAVAGVIWQWPAHPVSAPDAVMSAPVAGLQTVTLADGTLVRLNAQSRISAHYTATERRVTLMCGEAFFMVTKNPAVPFVVSAGPVAVCAVGTAFNVNLQATAVEVLVTEGRVRVENTVARAAGAAPFAIPMLKAGDRAVVALAPATADTAMMVTSLTKEELAQALDWQDPMVRLSGATLAELAAQFQSHTGQRLVLADPSIAQLRIGGRFRRDDVAGFVRLLEENYGMQSEYSPSGAIILRKGP